MAYYDWNYNGNKDFQNGFAEYSVCKQSAQNNPVRTDKEGMSDFGARCSAVLTFVLSAVIACAMGLEGVSLITVFSVLCAVIGSCIGLFFDEIGF